MHARTDADSTFHSFGSRRSLPTQVPHRDKIVRASTGVLSFSVSLLFPLSLFLSPFFSLCTNVVLPLLFNVYPLSSYLGALLIGLSSVLTMILAREHRYDRTTRSSYRRAMRPDALLLRKPNWPAFKKGGTNPLTFFLSPFALFPLSLSLSPPFLLFLYIPFNTLFSLLRRKSPVFTELLLQPSPHFNVRFYDSSVMSARTKLAVVHVSRPRSCYPFGGMKIPINELCLTAKGITYLSRSFFFSSLACLVRLVDLLSLLAISSILPSPFGRFYKRAIRFVSRPPPPPIRFRSIKTITFFEA